MSNTLIQITSSNGNITYLIHSRVAPVRDDTFHLLQLVVFVPHGATVADHTRHARIDDDVTGHVEVRDPLAGVHHGQGRSGGVHSLSSSSINDQNTSNVSVLD